MYNQAVPVLTKRFENLNISIARKFSGKKVQTETYYPESDGLPMAESTIHYDLIVKIKENLEILYADNSDVFIAGDLLWYPVENEIKSYGPDVMVIFGRPKGSRSSYLQWKEGNIAPQVIFEIRSPGNTNKDMKNKLDFYELYGVKEYYVYDYTRNKFEAWIRHTNRLNQVGKAEITNWISPKLNIRFEVTETLNLYYPDGRKFTSTLELESFRKSAEKNLEKEKQRAKKEKLRAEKEKQRADILEAKLKALELKLGK